ncbi:MAG: DUF3305 domain-containing protein [Anaerolineae bacterium]|nr:DUF3305 domain-containing protein [Anaerolineae bacterium]MCI0610876.1 DUF3305 domain-containing protein [Anaerolineae bacterium]
MPKKKRNKQIFESIQIESVEANAESKESEKVEGALPDLSPQEAAAEIPESDGQPADKESVPPLNDVPVSDEPANIDDEVSADDLLNDVRQSLIEDETVKDEKKSKKWWRRVAKGLQKDKKVETEVPTATEMNLPTVSIPEDVTQEQEEEKESAEYLDEIDELIDMLETETDESAAQTAIAVEVPIEPEIEIDIEELKKQAFQPRSEGEEQENITEVRSVALEGGEEVFVEVQATPQDPLEERLAAIENALKPYSRYINYAFAFVGLIMAVLASVVLFNIYRQNQPARPTEVVNLPYPTSMSLPGGLNFNLGKGTLKDGEWNPRGPEWLEGTEVCRWVAIPWSVQLEAVIRTLNPNDPIELVMSNNDRFVYKVYSVRQLSSEEMLNLDSNSPCLLLVLAQADSDGRWVLTALP